MVSHGRDKKETKAKPQQQQRRGKKKGGKSNDGGDHDDDAAVMRDMDLPDDHSIFGGSSVASSNDAGLAVEGFDGDGDDDGGDGDLDMGGDPERAECAAANRASRLSEALSLASTVASVSFGLLPELRHRSSFSSRVAVCHSHAGSSTHSSPPHPSTAYQHPRRKKKERRSAKREGVMRAIFKAVTTCATGPAGREILEGRWSSVWEACSCSVAGRGGAGPTEQYAACRVIEACSVVLGGDRDDVVAAVSGPLRKVVNATGRAAQVRGAALRCLSMVHFVCGTDCLEEGEDSSSVMDLCEAVGGQERYRGDRTPPSLRATALDCWSLLCTTLHDAHVAGGGGDDDDDADAGWGGGGAATMGAGRGLRLLPLLATCLDSSDPGLRRSAGEALSLIHECRLRMGIDDDEADNSTERKFVRGSWDGSDQEALMDEVRQRMSELSVTSSHRISKHARREQRSTFRDFASTVVEDEFPREVVNWRGGKLTLDSWGGIVQLNFVRHCLQGGFQVQLMTNETLHAIFGDALRAGGGGASSSLSQIEKRMFLSKTSEASKAADRTMTKQRRARTNVKNHFLTSDGEDI
jgi:hypothetical protein